MTKLKQKLGPLRFNRFMRHLRSMHRQFFGDVPFSGPFGAETHNHGWPSKWWSIRVADGDTVARLDQSVDGKRLYFWLGYPGIQTRTIVLSGWMARGEFVGQVITLLNGDGDNNES